MPPAATTGNAAGREVNDGWHDVQRGAGSAMPAGLGALRDENVGAGIQCRLRHVFALNLTDQQGSRGLDPRRKWSGIAEREHDRTRPGVQRDIQQFGLLRQAPGDEANAEGRACELSELGGLLFEPGSFAVAAAENTKSSGVAHRRRQPGTGNYIHRCQENRMQNAQKSVQ